MGVYKKAVNAGKWVFINSVTQKLLNIFTFLILARLLLPSDYGVIAVVFIVVGFFEVVTAPGFQKALLQRQGDADEYLDIDWTFNLIKSFFLFFIIFFSAPALAAFLNVADYMSVIRWSAIFVVITAFGNSKQFYFFKHLDFKKVFWRDIVSQISYMVVAISWALFIDASPWALFAGHLTRFIVGMIMSYVLYPNWQKMSFKFGKLRELWWYSKWVVGQNIFSYVIGILDTVYVGHFLNSSRLGLFTKARDLSYAPIAPFMNIVSRVGFPAYAQIQDKKEKVREGFIKTLDIILAVSIPLALLLLAEGGIIVQTLLGKNWTGMVLPLKILALATILSTLVGIAKPVFDALGKPDVNVRINIIQLLTSLVFIYFGVTYWNLAGVAWALVISWGITLTYSLYKVKPLIHVGWKMLLPTISSVFFANVAVLVLAVPSYVMWMKDREEIIFILPWITILGIVYLLSLWYMGGHYKTGPRHTFLSIVGQVRSKQKSV